MNELQWQMPSPVGKLFLSATDQGLSAVGWRPSCAPRLMALKGESPAVQILKRAVAQLEEYFAGRRQAFDLPLDMRGTEFQKRVWAELSRIPYGKTCSYRDIAERLRNQKAVRAVGSANGRNPVGIIVPCHRVIAADGSLGGYAAGLPNKTLLLELEARTLAPAAT